MDSSSLSARLNAVIARHDVIAEEIANRPRAGERANMRTLLMLQQRDLEDLRDEFAQLLAPVPPDSRLGHSGGGRVITGDAVLAAAPPAPSRSGARVLSPLADTDAYFVDPPCMAEDESQEVVGR